MAKETEIWRAALQAKGRDWVLSELGTRAGQPDDVLYDVVYEPPYPTREFCQRWCVDEDNKVLHMATSTKATLCALIIFVIFLAMGIHSFTVTQANQPGAVHTTSWGTPIQSSEDTPQE